jgi:hypothetical protein
MKRITLFIISILMLSGCAFMGGEIADTPNYQTMAYFSGRGVCVGVNELTPDSMDALEQRYGEFMTATAAQDIITPDQSMELYNDLALILAQQVADPYGLLNDLTFIMSQYGAQFATATALDDIETDVKIMTEIQPVPRNLYVAFARGWDASKWMIDNME